MLIAVDMQTMPGDWWMLNWDDDLVEGLCVAALSLARALVGDGIAAGLAVNAFSDRPQRTVFVPTKRSSRTAGSDGRPARRRQPVRLRVVRPPARRRRTQNAARVRPFIALSSRDPVEFVPTLRLASRPGLRCPPSPHRTERRPIDRPCAHAWYGEAPDIDSIPIGRLPMRSNASPESHRGPHLQPPGRRPPGSRLCTCLVERSVTTGPSRPCPCSPSLVRALPGSASAPCGRCAVVDAPTRLLLRRLQSVAGADRLAAPVGACPPHASWMIL